MTVLDRVAGAFERRVLNPLQHATRIDVDPETGVRARRYASYDAYVRHQSAKLKRHYKTLAAHDHAYEDIVAARYAYLPLKGASILCLGARMGGEVRAFGRLGALAIGVDLEPGPGNRHVLPGDVHALQFTDGVFDYAFTNILDHVLYLDQFAAEVLRVLKPQGRFLVEMARVPIKNYEVNDLTDDRVEELMQRFFRREREAPIENRTGYTDWTGVALTYAKSPGRSAAARQ